MEGEEELRYINTIISDIEILVSGNQFYSPKSKHVIFKRLEMEYNTLNSMIASRRSKEADQMKERGVLEAEFITYMNALGLQVENIKDIKLDELRVRVNNMRDELIEMESRAYIEENMTEIMEKMKYESVSTTDVSESDGILSMSELRHPL